jgi:hypothetical protein
MHSFQSFGPICSRGCGDAFGSFGPLGTWTVAVPGPIAGAGLHGMLLLLAGCGVLTWWRRGGKKRISNILRYGAAVVGQHIGVNDAVAPQIQRAAGSIK